jgi:hypothetical protein
MYVRTRWWRSYQPCREMLTKTAESNRRRLSRGYRQCSRRDQKVRSDSSAGGEAGHHTGIASRKRHHLREFTSKGMRSHTGVFHDRAAHGGVSIKISSNAEFTEAIAAPERAIKSGGAQGGRQIKVYWSRLDNRRADRSAHFTHAPGARHEAFCAGGPNIRRDGGDIEHRREAGSRPSWPW